MNKIINAFEIRDLYTNLFLKPLYSAYICILINWNDWDSYWLYESYQSDCGDPVNLQHKSVQLVAAFVYKIFSFALKNAFVNCECSVYWCMCIICL